MFGKPFSIRILLVANDRKLTQAVLTKGKLWAISAELASEAGDLLSEGPPAWGKGLLSLSCSS